MTYVGVIERKETVTIDGYSNRKTLLGAIKEFGRWIAKNVNEAEGMSIVKYGVEAMLSAENSCGGYFLEAEEVSCASEWNEETEEMEYKEGRWYLCCRIVK
jgi:hypothetical protein